MNETEAPDREYDGHGNWLTPVPPADPPCVFTPTDPPDFLLVKTVYACKVCHIETTEPLRVVCGREEREEGDEK